VPVTCADTDERSCCRLLFARDLPNSGSWDARSADALAAGTRRDYVKSGWLPPSVGSGNGLGQLNAGLLATRAVPAAFRLLSALGTGNQPAARSARDGSLASIGGGGRPLTGRLGVLHACRPTMRPHAVFRGPRRLANRCGGDATGECVRRAAKEQGPSIAGWAAHRVIGAGEP
jgi:hypothetical protein